VKVHFQVEKNLYKFALVPFILKRTKKNRMGQKKHQRNSSKKFAGSQGKNLYNRGEGGPCEIFAQSMLKFLPTPVNLALSSSSCAYLSITLGIKIKFSEFFSFPN
jgi:hypothetical protein